SRGMSGSPRAGSSGCVDWADGNASGGIAAYDLGSQVGPNSVVVTIAAAVPVANLASLSAGQEYAIASLTIDHARTVGGDACAGCNDPVCIVFDRLIVSTPVPAGNRQLHGGADGPGSDFAHWQGRQGANVVFGCPGLNFGCYHQFDCAANGTPTHNSTWGSVKALYR